VITNFVKSENPERKKDSPISCKEEAEWNLELGRNGVVYGSPDLEIEDAEEDTLFYKQYFYEHGTFHHSFKRLHLFLFCHNKQNLS
jgi:hypothetical protein